jgi:hypothetical protein
MPITYRIDHERRIVFARGLARFTEQDASNYQLEVWSNPAIQGYDELFDMTNVEEIEDASPERIRQFARESAKMDQPESHSRLAIAAPQDIAFGLGRMYQAFRELNPASTKKVGVFRSLREALAWLEIDDLSDWSEAGTK